MPFPFFFMFSFLIPVCFSFSYCFVRAAAICSSSAKMCFLCVVWILFYLIMPFVLRTFV